MIAGESYAQTISGTVIDQNSDPLIGVSVFPKNGSGGTVTDLDGKFELNLSDQVTTLVFSFIGYRTKDVPLDGHIKLNIILTEDVVGLQEVTVTALGIERQTKALGYSVQDI